MNVLLSIDGSSHSDLSIEALKGLTIPPKSRITIITVVPEMTFLGGLRLDMLRGSADAKERYKVNQEEKAKALLKKSGEQLDRKSFIVDTLVQWGKPAEQIMDAVAAIDADLVVVGAKGSGPSALFPFGSTAQKILKHANCSVLIARQGTRHINRILLATDGSKHAIQATYLLKDLCLAPETSIIATTTLKSHLAPYTDDSIQVFQTEDDILAALQTAEEEAGQDLLKFTVDELEERYIEVLPVILRGDPTQEILAAEERFNPDLIVLGAAGLESLKEFKLGYVAQRVAKYAKGSVLVVRPKGE